MPKISELFDPEKPGSVKVTHPHWKNNDDWFQPFYKYRDGINIIYCGLNSYGSSVINYDVDDKWIVWHEQKPESEKRFLWLVQENYSIFLVVDKWEDVLCRFPDASIIKITSKMIDEGF